MKKQAKPLTTPHGTKPKKRKKYRVSKATRAKYAAQMKINRKSREPVLEAILRMRHFVNGVVFGPGKIKGPQSQIQQFLGDEEKQDQQQRDLFTDKATIVGKRGPTGFLSTRQVAPETFDISLGEAEHAETTK